jgi:hypothetical protein
MQSRQTRLLDRQASVTKFKTRWLGKRPSQKEASTSSAYKPRSPPPSGSSSRSPRMQISNSGRSPSRRPFSRPNLSRWSTWTSPRDLGQPPPESHQKIILRSPVHRPLPGLPERPQDLQTLSTNQLSYYNGLRPGRHSRRQAGSPMQFCRTRRRGREVDKSRSVARKETIGCLFLHISSSDKSEEKSVPVSGRRLGRHRKQTKLMG